MEFCSRTYLFRSLICIATAFFFFFFLSDKFWPPRRARGDAGDSN